MPKVTVDDSNAAHILKISRRDVFAAMAMQSMLTQIQTILYDRPQNINDLTNNMIINSRIIADKMIEELDKK